MKPLERPDCLHLEAAKGWCELHAYLQANEELENISPELRAHPSVLEVRWQIYANLDKWDGALEISTALWKMQPQKAEGWIYRASSLAELGRQQDAYDLLKEAVTRFPKDEIIHYDLACIACALKRLPEAREWLEIAIELGGNEMKVRALDDEDLGPLWR
jgi:tetratricopeptide (TPR) repeat protein